MTNSLLFKIPDRLLIITHCFVGFFQAAVGVVLCRLEANGSPIPLDGIRVIVLEAIGMADKAMNSDFGGRQGAAYFQFLASFNRPTPRHQHVAIARMGEFILRARL